MANQDHSSIVDLEKSLAYRNKIKEMIVHLFSPRISHLTCFITTTALVVLGYAPHSHANNYGEDTVQLIAPDSVIHSNANNNYGEFNCITGAVKLKKGSDFGHIPNLIYEKWYTKQEITTAFEKVINAHDYQTIRREALSAYGLFVVLATPACKERIPNKTVLIERVMDFANPNSITYLGEYNCKSGAWKIDNAFGKVFFESVKKQPHFNRVFIPSKWYLRGEFIDLPWHMTSSPGSDYDREEKRNVFIQQVVHGAWKCYF